MGIIAVILLTFFVNVGLGRHLYCLPASAIPLIFKYSILAQIFNIAGIGLVKVSVCLHILRIVDRARRDISIFLRLLILVTFLSHMAQILLFCVQCRPMPAIWNPQQYPHAKCFSSHITYLAGYIGFGLDAFTDLMTAIIPIVVIRALQMNTRTKTALCILMGLGVLTAICAVAKAITLQGVFAADYTWALWRPGLCTIIEHLMGMIIASAPALNPLFKRALRTPTSVYGSSNSHSSDRGEKQEAERQCRRVTCWADAWTPPNVHVGHYSPYAIERKRQPTKIPQHLQHPHHRKSNHPTKVPSIATTTTSFSSSDATALNTSLTVLGTDRRTEITKTVSFRRVSEDDGNYHCAKAGVSNILENDNNDNNTDDRKKNNNNNNSNNTKASITTPTIIDRLARASNGHLIPDRLWIGNGYWDLPAAPAATSAPTTTTTSTLAPATDTAGSSAPRGTGAAQGKEESCPSTAMPTAAAASARDEPLLVLSPLLPPHPAVGRWVGSGGQRPLAREEERRVAWARAVMEKEDGR